MVKKPIIIANWKLNGSKKLIHDLLKPLNQFLLKFYKICTVIIAPPIIYSAYIQYVFKNEKENFFLGAQNVDLHFSGAFTGEISPIMLKDLGIKYVLIGHSERRYLHNESNSIIAKKFKILKEEKLIPVLCIGETLEERKLNKTKEILKKQIDCIFDVCGISAFFNSIVAYEPIWAIGSGVIFSPKEMQLIINFIRNYIKSKTGSYIENFYIQYGGSVTFENSKSLIIQKDIDGFLVGGSSLKFKEFKKIIESVNF